MLKSEARPFLLYPSSRSSHLLPSITSSSLSMSNGKEISIPNAKTSLDLMPRLTGGCSFEKSHILKGLGLNFYYFIKSNIEIRKYISLFPWKLVMTI